jgi:hypothetical protein
MQPRRPPTEAESDVSASWLVTAVTALRHAAGDEVRAGRLSAEEAASRFSTTAECTVGPAASYLQAG